MLKSFLKFALILIVTHMVTYFVAGVVSQQILGANQFYPPSPNAISYLRDPHDLGLQIWIFPAQVLRALLFALVLFPFRKQIMDFGIVQGGLLVAGFVFIAGYVAASGGMIEHFVYFKAADYPAKFALITFIEILIQVTIMGPWTVAWMKKANIE
jgi:hypothetical protein